MRHVCNMVGSASDGSWSAVRRRVAWATAAASAEADGMLAEGLTNDFSSRQVP